MRFDVSCSGVFLDQLGRCAQQAEELGLAGVWLTETRSDALLASAIASAATRRVDVGTAIAVAFPRSPMVTAYAAWDLARLSRGRFHLGLGTQVKAHVERRYSVPFSQPARRMREYVLALRAIFEAFQSGGPLKFEGEFYRFSLLTDFFRPEPIAHPRIPVYVAGVNRQLARVAGEVCDGFHVHPLHSRAYLERLVLPEIAAGAHSAGRERGAVAIAVPVFIIAGDKEEELQAQRASVRRQIGFYGSTPTYRTVFEVHGWQETADRLRQLQRSGDVEGMAAAIGDDMLEAFAVTARWDALAQVLRERYAGIADRIYPYTRSPVWGSAEQAQRWRAVAAALRAA